MTRIFTDGAEFGDILFWDTSYPINATTARKRSGNYSYDLLGNGGYANKYITAVSEFYLRFGYNTGGTDKMVSWIKGSNVLGSIGINSSTHKLELYIGTTLTSTGTSVVSANTWFLVEAYIKINDSGHITIKMDGIQEIDYSGDTKPASDSDIDTLKFLGMTGNSWVDDLAMNDTNNADGKNDNSWCGDGHIEYLPANGEGDTLQWTPSTGTTHYTMVDEIPPNSDTDYVYCSGSNTGFQDMYNVADFTSTGKIIKRVWAEGRAKDNAVSGGGIKLGFKTSGCVSLSSASTVLSGNYSRVIGDYGIISPYTSASWTGSDLNSIQFIIECE